MTSSRGPHHNVRRVHVSPGLSNSQQVPPVSQNNLYQPAYSGIDYGNQTVPEYQQQYVQQNQQNLPSPEQIAQMSESVRSQLYELLMQLQGSIAYAEQLKNLELSQAAQRVEQTRIRVEQLRKQTINQVNERFSSETDNAVSSFKQSSLNISPSVITSPINDIVEKLNDNGGKQTLTPFMKFGDINVQGQTVAALAPFACMRNWLISGDKNISQELIFNSLIRIASIVPLKHLRILVFDPRISAGLGALAPLRAINGTTFPQAFSDEDSFAEALEHAMQSAARNAERMSIQGKKTLLDLWASSSVPEGELVIAVLLDYPYGIQDRLKKILCRAAEVGPASGLSIIVQNTSNSPFEGDEFTNKSSLLRMKCSKSCWYCEEFFSKNVTIAHESIINSTVLSKLIDAIAEQASKVQGPTYPLYDLIKPIIEKPWQGDSTDSLDALIGKNGQQNLLVSFRSENPPTPNMLVGGAVGQGKSNLLLDIIFALTSQYSPDELELLLLDFKRGLEFKRFDKDENNEGWMPHVKVLSLESNQQFGVAVLRYVEKELERRSRMFKNAGAHSIIDYRQQGNKLSRMLLIIDEFHVLFDGDDENVEEAVRLLELIAKQGRAYGVHILLASQTTSGISGLRVKGESIFAQFPLRMSLKNTVQESQAVLSQHNTAAAELTYRGEVIFNKNFGQDPEGSNIKAVAAWVDSNKFEKIQHNLWSLRHDDPPMVFIGSDYASWDSAQVKQIKPRTDDMVEAWIGRPIAITKKPYVVELDTDTNQGIAMVGTGDQEAVSVIISASATVLKTIGNNAHLVVLCGLNKIPEEISQFFNDVRNNGIDVTFVPRKEVPEYLVSTFSQVFSDGEEHPTLVLGLGIQRIPGMSKTIVKSESDPDIEDFSLDFSEDEPLNTGNSVIEKICHEGGLQKIFCIGWWSSLQGVSDTLGYSRSGIGKYLLLKTGIDDAREIAGPLMKLTEDHPRVTVIDKGSEEGAVTLVPFSTLPDDFWENKR